MYIAFATDIFPTSRFIIDDENVMIFRRISHGDVGRIANFTSEIDDMDGGRVTSSENLLLKVIFARLLYFFQRRKRF